MKRILKIGAIASGSGSNFEAIVQATENGILKGSHYLLETWSGALLVADSNVNKKARKDDQQTRNNDQKKKNACIRALSHRGVRISKTNRTSVRQTRPAQRSQGRSIDRPFSPFGHEPNEVHS